MILKAVYSIIGLLLGFACIVVGLVLSLNGVSGHTSWTAEALGLSTTLNDAAPGVIVFVVGAVMVWITRFKVKETYRGSSGRPAVPADEPTGFSGGGAGAELGWEERTMVYQEDRNLI